jgi:hypothetical protein
MLELQLGICMFTRFVHSCCLTMHKMTTGNADACHGMDVDCLSCPIGQMAHGQYVVRATAHPNPTPILACFPVASHSSNLFICFFTKMLFKCTFSHSLQFLTCITPADPLTNFFALSTSTRTYFTICCQTARVSAEPDWKKWPRKSERLSLLYI